MYLMSLFRTHVPNCLRFTFATAFLLTAGCRTSAVPSYTLVRFDNQAVLADWQVRENRPETVFKLVPQPDEEVATCLEMTFPPVQQTKARWPAAIWKGDKLPIRDWRLFESIELDIWSDFDESEFTEESCEFFLFFCDDRKRRTSLSKPDLHKGAQTLRVPLTAGKGNTNWGAVAEMHLVMQDPEDFFTIRVTEIRLIPRDLPAMNKDFATQAEPSLRTAATFTHLPSAQQKAVNENVAVVRKMLNRPVPTSLANATEVQAATAWVANMERAQAALTGLQTMQDRCEVAQAARGEAFAWGWTTSLEKVARNEAPFGGTMGGAGAIDTARNEAEAAQLVLLPLRDLRGVRVRLLEAPRSAGGARIAPEQINIAPVGYVKTTRPPYAVSRIGWWADPILLYTKTCDLEALNWQPYWIEVTAPAQQAAGVYQGLLEVVADGVPARSIPFSVRVRGFALPDGSELPVAFAFLTYHDTRLPTVYYNDPDVNEAWRVAYREHFAPETLSNPKVRHCAEILEGAFDLAFAHRLSPDLIYRSDSPTAAEVLEWKRRGASRFCILHVGSVHVKEGDPYPEKRRIRIMNQLERVIPEYEKAGVLDLGYIYCFDEVKQNQFVAMRDILGRIRQRWPRIPIITTAYDYSFGTDTNLDDLIDAWTPLTPKYDKHPEQIAAARGRGRKVWWYVCCGPKNPYANFFIEYSAAEHRLLPGFMAHKFASDGFLYYGTAIWRKEARKPNGKLDRSFRTKPMEGAPLTDWAGHSYRSYNGDGNFLYPRPGGIVPSTRLKNVRDGLEDYIYLKQLERALAAADTGSRTCSRSWRRRARRALAVYAAVVDSLTVYDKQGTHTLAARREIADLLEENTAK